MALLASSAVVAADALADSGRDDVLALIMRGGLERRLVSLSSRFSRQIRAGVKAADLAANGGRLGRLLGQALEPLALVQEVSKELSARLNEAEVRTLAGYLAHAKGRRLVAAEVAGERLWDDEAALRHKGGLVLDNLPEARRSQLRALVDAKREGALLASLGTHVGVASIRFLTKLSESEKGRYEREVRQREQAMEERFSKLSLWRHALMLREFDAEEIELATGFYGSSEGRRYTTGFIAGCQAAILAGITVLSQSSGVSQRS